MTKFTVLILPIFEEKFRQLTTFEQRRIHSFIQQLEENGDLIGKPLGGKSYFREKKFNGNRMYYLVYSEWKTIALVTISDKKDQQHTITRIEIELPSYYEQVRQIIAKKGII